MTYGIEDESQIIIDVLIAGTPKEDDIHESELIGSALRNYMRAHNLKKDHKGMNEIYGDLSAHPKVNFRNLIWESKSSIEGHGGK